MSTKPKKQPGRPRKTPIEDPPQIHGIISEPFDSNNFMEFEYQHPLVMKQLSSFLHGCGTSQIMFDCQANFIEISMIGQSHDLKSVTVIDCKKCVRYYCKSPIQLYISATKFHDEFNQISKSCTTFTISLNKSMIGQSIDISMYLKSLNAAKNSKVELIAPSDDIVFEPFGDFTNFKYKIISDSKAMKLQLNGHKDKKIIASLIKTPTTPFVIILENDVKTSIRYEFTNVTEGDEETRLEENEIINCRIHLHLLKNIFSIPFAKTFTIYLVSDTKVLIMYDSDASLCRHCFYINI